MTHEVNSETDYFFDGWRIPLTDNANALVAEVIADAEAYEQANSPRKRKRRAKDQATFESTIGSVTLDLAYVVLTNEQRLHVVPRSRQLLNRKDRYRAAALNGTLPDVLDLLQASGWLTQTLGHRVRKGRNQRTSIKPTLRLLQRIEELGLTLSDIGKAKSDELLILKTAKQDYWHGVKRVQYVDNDKTIHLRRQLQTINQWLDQAHIEFDPTALRRDIEVDPQVRTLRRYFTCSSFESGGRLFGGFWQRLNERERLEGILINGEEVAELDYGQVAVRILYGLAKAPIPEGDLYDIPGLTNINGQSYRDGVKLLFNSLTFREGEPTSKPKDSSDKLPPDLSITQIVSLIRQAHPHIAHYLCTNIGHYCQYIESKVMVEVMLRLMNRHIHCLPIHDSIIVPYSAMTLAKGIMEDVFHEIVGTEAIVECVHNHLCINGYEDMSSDLDREATSYAYLS